MKKMFLIFAALFALNSCTENKTVVVKETAATTIVEDSTSKDVIKPVCYIDGSSFGEYFQALYKLNQFDKMVEETCKESVEKYGKEKLVEFYKTLKFAYNIGKMKASIENSNGTITLIYSKGSQFATNTKTDIIVKKENGDCKIVLPDKLSDFLK